VWIERHKDMPDIEEDYMIFGEDSQEEGFQAFRNKMTMQDWEEKFEYCLCHHLIEVPDDFYTETIFFQDPAELNQIFENYEGDNLFLIHNR